MSVTVKQLIAAAALTFALSGTAQATTINFDTLPSFSNYDHIPGGFGSTADVAVSYQSLQANFSPGVDYAESWHTGYADLNTAAYSGMNGYILDITLTATDPTKSVVLNSFDVAAYPGPANFIRKADIFEVIDGSGNVLKNYGQFDISGLVAQTLYPNVAANSISILLGYDWNNGINNIDFSIGSGPVSAVPEPSTMLLLGIGLAGLAGFRKKTKKS